MFCARFQFAPSVRSVKVVRHKDREYCVRGCGKAADFLSPGFSDFENCPTQAKSGLEWATRQNNNEPCRTAGGLVHVQGIFRGRVARPSNNSSFAVFHLRV